MRTSKVGTFSVNGFGAGGGATFAPFFCGDAAAAMEAVRTRTASVLMESCMILLEIVKPNETTLSAARRRGEVRLGIVFTMPFHQDETLVATLHGVLAARALVVVVGLSHPVTTVLLHFPTLR